jgi:hypothetical protein
MKTRITIIKLITITMMVATLVTAGLLQPVKAQLGDGSVRFVSYASVGIVRGQRIRLSLSNTGASGGSATLSFSWYLAHGTNSASSVPIYESEWIKVPSKEFRCVDVSREDLNIEGEPETGRAQVVVRVTIIAPAGSNADDFPASLEILEDKVQDGETVVDSKYRLILVAARRSKPLNVPIGFNPGERLRYSFFYPKEEGDQPVSVQPYVYDSYGNLLTQTDPVVMRPGDSHVFDIDRDQLRVPGEERTGRLQVRPSIKVALLDGAEGPVNLSLTVEVVNNRSGSTSSAGTYYTGTVSVSGDGF